MHYVFTYFAKKYTKNAIGRLENGATPASALSLKQMLSDNESGCDEKISWKRISRSPTIFNCRNAPSRASIGSWLICWHELNTRS